jgi:hypothetical protein
MRIGELHPDMEKYRQLLEFQYEMVKICEERNAKRKSEKANKQLKKLEKLKSDSDRRNASGKPFGTLSLEQVLV